MRRTIGPSARKDFHLRFSLDIERSAGEEKVCRSLLIAELFVNLFHVINT